MIYVIARISLLPDSVAKFVAMGREAIEGTRREKGCISYDCVVPTDQPDTVMFVERWESREALEAHFSAPHLTAFREARKPLVRASAVEIVHVEHVETR